MSVTRSRRRIPLAAAVIVSLLLAALAFSQVRFRASMSDFVPAGDSAAARLMRAEISTGTAMTLIMAGIEGKDPAELARICDALAAGLRQSGQFAFVANGRDLIGDAELDWLFRHRYLLSPSVTAEGFETAALRHAFERLLTGLQGSAAPLLTRYGFADPTGAFLGLVLAARGAGDVQTRHGVWFAPPRPDRPDRALLIARMRVGGLDVEAQDMAIASVHAAFAAARPGETRLLLSGPAVHAHDAAHAIRSDVTLLSIVSGLLIAALLVWRFRSLWVIAAIMVPIVLSVSAAALAVQLTFGFVHGITLGFGMTMLGVTVDYPVLLIGHRKRGEQAPDTLRRIGAAFNLAVMTAALGLTGMIFSSFPGLSQLGLFSVVGVLTAAAVTRWILPSLIAAADLAPVSAGDPAVLRRLEKMRSWRLAALPLVAGAAAISLLGGAPPPERDIAALSPVPQAARTLDASLRADLGVPDTGPLLIVQGPSAESVLRREEELAPRIATLARQGILAGIEAANLLLPSIATQQARRAMLPAKEALTTRVSDSIQGLPFKSDAFDPFIGDMAAARDMPPLRPEDIDSPILRERLAPLLFEREGVWYGLIVPRGVSDPARLAAALPDADGLVWLNMRAEADFMLVHATTQAWRWLAGGGAAAFVALAISLRDWRRVARVAGAVGAALLLTFAILGLSGARLSLLHIVALQLVAGVGLNYALFFARRQLDDEERSRTLRTLVTCNVMSLLTFGLLAFCRTPLLREIGVTTAIGVVSAMFFAFLFAGEARPAVKVER
ncbi:MAG: hypothetical protein EXR07_11050 [Acetobacteraceae bacterium]|nr:hypothetical protein [Acetobacteraceae bacterium]